MLQAFAEAQQFDDLIEVGGVTITVSASDVDGHVDVGTRVERRQEIEFLEHKSDLCLAQTCSCGVRERAEVDTINQYLAGISLGQSSNQIEEG